MRSNFPTTLGSCVVLFWGLRGVFCDSEWKSNGELSTKRTLFVAILLSFLYFPTAAHFPSVVTTNSELLRTMTVLYGSTDTTLKP